MLVQYLKYRTRARGVQSIHSPFLYDFYKDIIQFTGNDATEYVKISAKEYFNSDEVVQLTDFGAGSRKKNNRRTLKGIAKTSGTSPRWGKFLYALADRFGNGNILELGTNLGIGTAYLSKGCSGKVISLEGCPNLAEKAEAFLSDLDTNNTEIVVGRIQNTLKGVLERFQKVDLAFIDAHHSYEATMEFYNLISAYCGEKSIIVIDDINWSPEMQKAFKDIITDPQVTMSLDLFYKGVVMFDGSLSKEHFILKH